MVGAAHGVVDALLQLDEAVHVVLRPLTVTCQLLTHGGRHLLKLLQGLVAVLGGYLHYGFILVVDLQNKSNIYTYPHPHTL